MTCQVSGNTVTCVTPGGHQASAPADGLPPDTKLARGDPDYHYYRVSDGPVGADPSTLAKGLVENPTPAPRFEVRPATPEGTRNPASPWYVQFPSRFVPPAWLAGSPAWPVKSYTTTDQNGMPVIMNVTQPGHPLYPGVVMRYPTESPSGSGSTIQTESAGLGWWQGGRSIIPQAILNSLNDFVWQGQSDEIMNRERRRQRDGMRE